LLFAIQSCGSSDGDGVATGEATTTAATEPAPTATPDPAEIERQAALDAILVDYPGVTGEIAGTVAVLEGQVADQTEKALLDQAVRASVTSDVANRVVAREAAAPSQVAGYTLNDLIDAQPELTQLRSVLDQAGLSEALGGNGPFTLFAPTNDAFAAVSDQLAELGQDPEALRNALLYHLLRDAQDSTAVSAASSLPTLFEGQSIEVSTNNGTIILNGSSQVLVGDASAANGVMHIIDKVILPTVAVELPEEIGAELGLSAITFGSGSAELTDAGKVELDKVVAFLQANPGNIEIGGHTDADGEASYNLTLSQDRAEAVKRYLSEQGIAAESLTAVGFGEDQPIAGNDSAEDKARNRRIEFRPN